MSIAARLAKLEQRFSPARSHVLFGHSRDEVHAQRKAMIDAGKASEHDDFVMFVTILEARPQ
ncbi:hypothetical protein [Bosea sp. UC22_33]|uniref:hypothetical protein n=1 Tax=Bosea sp. UC22_33 TaxID=3350165 RepID=UPI00367338C4